jgi:hypothetical protein
MATIWVPLVYSVAVLAVTALGVLVLVDAVRERREG